MSLDRLAPLLAVLAATACVSNRTDFPAVEERPASGDRITILAGGETDRPYAERTRWTLAAHLAADLEEAGFVPSVVLEPAAAPADVPIIEAIVPRSECYSHPFFSVLTAGVIPHFGCREYGHRFELRCPDAASSVEVNAGFKVRTYTGWLVWPLALAPDWVHDSEGPPMRRREEVLYLRQQLQDALRNEGCAG